MIEAAEAAIVARDEAIARLHTDPIALVGQMMCFAKGMQQAETRWFSPLEAAQRRSLSRQVMEPETARSLLELAREGKLPSWVLEYLDLELVRQAAQ